MPSLRIVIEKEGQDPVLVLRPFLTMEQAEAAWLKEVKARPHPIILDKDLVQDSGLTDQVTRWTVAQWEGQRQVIYTRK